MMDEKGERRRWAYRMRAMMRRERRALIASPRWDENYDMMARNFNDYLIIRIEERLRKWGG